MPLNNTAKNAMLDELGSLAVYVSLHSGDPGTTGLLEVTGGTYARQSITWNAASAGNLDSSNQPVFNVPASTTVTHVGLWSAVTLGTFYGSFDVADETFNNAGTYTLTDADIILT